MGYFFCAVAFSVQVRLNCPEILESRYYYVFFEAVSFMGMIIEKDYTVFGVAVLLFRDLFFSSAVTFSKKWYNGISSWKQLRIGSLNCL